MLLVSACSIVPSSWLACLVDSPTVWLWWDYTVAFADSFHFPDLRCDALPHWSVDGLLRPLAIHCRQLLENMLLLKQVTCCLLYVEEFSNRSTCNVVGNMLPKYETFLIGKQRVSFQHTLG